MSQRRSASHPSFGGQPVVLDDDIRLSGAVPTVVPADVRWLIGANLQALAIIPIRVDGTVICDGTLVNF